MNNMFEKIAKHSGFSLSDIENFNVFVSCNEKPFGDASDDILTAFVRYTSPDNEHDWAYDVYVLYNTSQPSLVFYEIEMVFSTHHNLFSKKKLIIE